MRTARNRNRRGAIIVLIAITLPVLLVISALVVNTAYLKLVRTELRISTDAATRASGRMLAVTGDKNTAKTFARDAATRNLVGGQPLGLKNQDIEFGISTRTTTTGPYTFAPDPSATYPNSIRIHGRRTDGSQSGSVANLLPGFLDRTSVDISMESVSTQLELDIAIVIDRSGSMIYRDDEISGAVYPPPSASPTWDWGDAVPADGRWHDAVSAVDVFLNELTKTPLTEKVALVTYADGGAIDVSMTSNYASVLTAMGSHSSSFAGGSTNIGGGIYKGVDAFSDPAARPWAAKAIVLLTDGIHYTGTSPWSGASRAKNNLVTVYTVTFSDEADTSTMAGIANKTGGVHIHAPTGAALRDAFATIANSLPTLLTK